MIRALDDLILLKEIDNVIGIDYTSSELRKKFPKKIVVIRRISYIKKDVVCDTALSQVTDLTNYIQLGELAETIGIERVNLVEKILFMKKCQEFGKGIDIFDYKMICNIYFIKMHSTFKEKIMTYQPFLATYKDAENMICGDMLGDLKIGFY
jgi:hypothetical protein